MAEDLNNYKGIFFDDDKAGGGAPKQYNCPFTGAHFRFSDISARLERIRISRGDPHIEFDAQGNKILVRQSVD